MKITQLAIAISLFQAVVLTGCTRSGSSGSELAFRSFEKDDVKTWDPANAYDSVSLEAVPAIYETLYQYRYLSETYQVEPLLAASMPTYSADHLTLKIPIKKGVKFQNDSCFKTGTRELKAQDFVYALKRLALPSLQSQGWWILDGKVAGITAFHEKLLKASTSEVPRVFAEEVEGIRALDDYTLQLKLVKPYPQLMYILTMSFTAPVAVEAVEAHGDEKGNLTDHPVGTGPFQLKKWERNHEIVLVKNPNFRKELYPAEGVSAFQVKGMMADAGKRIPLVDEVSLQIIKEDQPRWLNFLKGRLDVIQLPKDNFNQAINNQVNLTPEFVKKGIRLSIETGVVIRYLGFNMKDPLLGKNKHLRQALSSAINREQWISIFTNGTGRKMVNSIPPGIEDRPKTEQIKYDFDLARAKDLLKQAGYPNGTGLPRLKFDLRGASSTDRQLGDFIAQQWNQIGVKVEVISNTFPAFLEKSKRGNYQISYGGWQMDYPDAENIFQLLYGPNQSPGPGEANYDNPVFNRMYEQIAVLDPGPKHAELIQKMDDLIQEECPWAFGFYEADYFLTHPWVMNYRGNLIILNKLKYFRVNSQIKKRYLESS